LWIDRGESSIFQDKRFIHTKKLLVVYIQHKKTKFIRRIWTIMNKTDLIAAVADAAKITKVDAEKAVNATVDSIVAALKKGDKVAIQGFGGFEVKTRAARVGKHPQTGAKITIPASKTVAFKVGKALKETL
jgi:DNA-binding protein HU-beta